MKVSREYKFCKVTGKISPSDARCYKICVYVLLRRCTVNFMSQLTDAQLDETKISKGWQLRNERKQSSNLWKRRKTEIIIQSQPNVKGTACFRVAIRKRECVGVFEMVINNYFCKHVNYGTIFKIVEVTPMSCSSRVEFTWI